MKQICRFLSIAAMAALAFSACTEELNNDNINGGKTVTVHFGTENTDPSTKATLTPNAGETAFQAAWENEDKIAVKYTYVANAISETVPGTWDASASKFSAELTDLTTGDEVFEMKYQASYPYSETEYVDFGSARTQTGNVYNSVYDLMVAEPVTVTAKPGIDESGNAIVFPMQRQTAIAYFHFTSDNTEAITKATLKVEGEGAAIAAEKVRMDPTGMDYETGLSEIVLTTTDQTADDFTLWFNVLPTSYSKMTITVETETKTFTISKNTAGEYVAGKLYKVSKAIANEKWESKYSVKCRLISDAATLNDGDKIIFVNQANSIVAASTITNNYFQAISGVTFNTDKSLAYMPESDYLVVTIKSNGEGWLFENAEGKYLKLTNTKTGLSFDAEGTTWTISIDNNSSDATISGQYNTTSTSLQWNTGANPMRLSNYTSTQSAVYIYVVDDPRTALDTPENLSISNMTLSWNAVPNAKEYKVTIGSEVATVSETSYTLSLEADYYNVSVIAVAEEGSAFKNSVAATLTDAKFGTPTLTAPTLKEGTVDEFSVNATWTVDSRATAGYNCELYNRETKVGDSKTVNTGSVTFDGLNDGVTYTVKVNAIAVEGTKAYAASAVATIDLTTKGTVTLSQITKAGTYTVKNVTVYAVIGKSTAVIGDGTAYFYMYKSNHGLAVGNTFTIGGDVQEYNGVLQFNSPTISNKATGSTPVYENPVEADEAYLTSYASAPVTEYIHAKGTQSGRSITVGSKKLNLSANNTATDGKDVEVYGFVYGYSSSNNDAYFYATSIAEDPTAPKLSVTPTSKTWESEETDAAVFTVTTNAEGVNGWSVTHDPIDWATVAIDKDAGTITVTPKDANTAKTANEAKLTVKHAAGTLSETITLTQKGTGAVEAVVKTYQHVFTKNPSTGNNVTLSGVSWNITATNLNGYNSQNYAGVQIGSSKKDGQITLTSSSAWSYTVGDLTVKKIKEVRLWLNLGGTSVTPSVTIGGQAATSDGTKVTQNKNAVTDWTKTTKVTFTPAAGSDTGVIVIDVTSVKAGYICAIEIDAE